jgi:dissimilatory sulfite reductase (desulfoviridin) alpha/beta subunit
MEVDYKALKSAGFMQQIQKDNFSMRLKVVGGNLTAEQLTTIAEVAKKYGTGYVHLTSRQGVEIPFIKLDDIETVKAELLEGGVQVGVCGPRVRTVTACQGNAVCGWGCIDTQLLATEISDRYFGRILPHKFKFGITGCMNNCLRAEQNDLGIKGGYQIEWDADSCTLCGICVETCREGALTEADEAIDLDENKCVHCGRCVKACPAEAWSGESGYILSFGGRFGNSIAKGQEVLPFIHSKELLFQITDATLGYFEEFGNPGERLRVTIDREGWDGFKSKMDAAYHE